MTPRASGPRPSTATLPAASALRAPARQSSPTTAARTAHSSAAPLALWLAGALGRALLAAALLGPLLATTAGRVASARALSMPPPRIAAQLPAEQIEPGVFLTQLPSGMRVLTWERPDAEVAALSVFVRGGSRDEDPHTVGSAHFMEHMFFQGTPRRPSSNDIDSPITERGGWLNATTAWEGITFFTSVPNGAFDVALDVIADILVNSVFDPDALEKERRVVIEELNRNLNNPIAYAYETFAKTVFADHPASQLPAGDRTTVRSVSRDVLLEFRDQYFRASNLVVAAVGNLRHQQVVADAVAAFADMRAGPPPTFTRAPVPPARRQIEQIAYGARQAQLVVGWPAPGFDSPDRYALDVLATALGSGGQLLAAELRDDRGLVTRVDAAYWELTDVGTWFVGAAAEPANVDAALSAILDEIRAVRDGSLPETDLEEAKAYVRGSTRRGFERAIDQAQYLSTGIALGYYMPIETYVANISAVTAADVQRVARAYLDLDNYALVVLGP